MSELFEKWMLPTLALIVFLHLVIIALYDKVLIYESNLAILVIEIIVVLLIAEYGIWRLLDHIREMLNAQSKTHN